MVEILVHGQQVGKQNNRIFNATKSKVAIRFWLIVPDSKVHGANMGPTWVLSAPGGPHVGPMKLAIRGGYHPVGLAHWRLSSFICQQYQLRSEPAESPGGSTGHVNPCGPDYPRRIHDSYRSILCQLVSISRHDLHFTSMTSSSYRSLQSVTYLRTLMEGTPFLKMAIEISLSAREGLITMTSCLWQHFLGTDYSYDCRWHF